MKSLKEIRIQLGLTQDQMAQYFQIQRSLYSLCEINKRDLPTDALVKLAAMELFLLNRTTQQESIPAPKKEEQLEKVALLLEKHQKECEFQRLVLEKQLVLMQEKYQNNIQLFEFLTELEVQNTNSSDLQNTWIAMMKSKALQQIDANGLHKQAKIKLELQKHIPQLYDEFMMNLIINT